MSNINHQPHDKLVGKLLTDKKAAIDLLKNHLPAKSLEKLNLSTLKPSSETAVSDQWKKLHNDVVFHCKTKDKKNAYIYLLIEHQSTPDRLMPLRMLRYKVNLLGRYLDAKSPPEKVPNIISLVIYHGEKEYPYKKDIFSCFEDEEEARKAITEPMLLIDLANTSEEMLLQHGGADTLLKLLLKYSREKDFIRKINTLMESHPKIFVSLSVKQASFVFEYILHLGKGTPKNVEVMKAAMNQIYGEAKANEFFSLVDYFKQEGREKGKIEGILQGEKKGKLEGILQGEKKANALWVEKIKEAQDRGILDAKAVEILLNKFNVKG